MASLLVDLAKSFGALILNSTRMSSSLLLFNHQHLLVPELLNMLDPSFYRTKTCCDLFYLVALDAIEQPLQGNNWQGLLGKSSWLVLGQ